MSPTKKEVAVTVIAAAKNCAKTTEFKLQDYAYVRVVHPFQSASS